MKYFTFEEFEQSEKARKHGIDNTIPKECKKKIEALVENVLDPLREEYGKPILISSGYRCRGLNKLIGGSSTSQHCKGEAADLVVDEGKDGLLRLMEIILENGMMVDQCIIERSGKSTWLHVSWKFGGPQRNQFLTYKDGKYARLDKEYIWVIMLHRDLPIEKREDEDDGTLTYGGCV